VRNKGTQVKNWIKKTCWGKGGQCNLVGEKIHAHRPGRERKCLKFEARACEINDTTETKGRSLPILTRPLKKDLEQNNDYRNRHSLANGKSMPNWSKSRKKEIKQGGGTKTNKKGNGQFEKAGYQGKRRAAKREKRGGVLLAVTTDCLSRYKTTRELNNSMNVS